MFDLMLLPKVDQTLPHVTDQIVTNQLKTCIFTEVIWYVPETKD